MTHPDSSDATSRETFPSGSFATADSLTRTENPDLVRQCDIKGVLHTHTRVDDGFHSLSAMVETAREIGLEYLGVSDHYRCSTSRNGMDSDGMKRQRDEIEDLMEKYPGFDILQGVELDVCSNGSLPLDEKILDTFDYVIVSLDGSLEEDAVAQTERALRIIQNPLTKIISKPLGNLMLRRPPVPLDIEAVLAAAAETRTAVEIDAHPSSFELDWFHCHLAQELGVLLSINPNAHRAARLVDYRHGVELARRAGICCSSILNTMTSQKLRDYFNTHTDR